MGGISSGGDVTLATADIEIGAVEIKNATDDTRAKVLAASTAAAATDTPLVVALHPSSPLGAGTAAIGKLAANSGVDIGDVDVTSVVPGTGASNLGKAEDAAHASGDVGIFALGVANEAQTALAADGDYIAQATDTKGNRLTVGNVASGAADSGNPVKVGAVRNEWPSYGAGQRGNLHIDEFGNLRVTLVSNNSFIQGTFAEGDGVPSNYATVGRTAAQGYGFNGTQSDRWRNNVGATLLSSAARSATTNSADQVNYNGRGVVIILDITATPNNAETLTLAVQIKDPISGKYVTVTAFTPLVASALGAAPTAETYIYTLYPGALETAAVAKHEVQGLALSREWRVVATHSAGGSWSYSIHATTLL